MTREELIEELLQLPECAEVRITHDADMWAARVTEAQEEAE